MKNNKNIYAGLVAVALRLTTSFSDNEFADLNPNPSVVTPTDIRHISTQRLQNFKP